MNRQPKWLTWAKEMQSIAQAGLTYSKDIYDIERFEQLRDLAAQVMTEYTQVESEKIKDLFCNETGYQTPKIDVRGVVFKDHKILLVKEAIDGKWSLPGGWAEVNLSPAENVLKEVKEESGLDVSPSRIIAVQDRKYHNQPLHAYSIYKIFILCDLVGGSFIANNETLDAGFFGLDELPDLSSGRVNREQIAMCFDAVANQNLPVYFD